MEIKKYRVIRRVSVINKKPYLCFNYVVQVKLCFIWIDIKKFIEGIYDNDIDFCKRKAIELYDKLIEK